MTVEMTKIASQKKASETEERFVRDETPNEVYMPLSSTILLERKKEKRYVPVVFENGLRLNAIVESVAYVSAIAQNELNRSKQQQKWQSQSSVYTLWDTIVCHRHYTWPHTFSPLDNVSQKHNELNEC